MATSQTKAPVNIRAAAILTTGAVASSTQTVLQGPIAQKLMLFITFTLGSLTNVIVTPQVSYDGATWFDLVTPGALTLTASGTKAVPVDCSGAKLFRCTAQGTGVVTSSSLALDLGFQTYQVAY